MIKVYLSDSPPRQVPDMKQLKGATAWYLGAGMAAVLVMLAGWFLLVSPQQGQAAEITATAEAKAGNVKTLELQIASLKAESKNLPRLQKQSAAIRAHLPMTPDMPSLLRDISNQAKAAGVTLVGVTPQQPTRLSVIPSQGAASGASSLTGSGQVNAIPLTIQLTGSFVQVRNFLTNLENMQRSLLLTDIDITRADATGGTSGNKELKATLSGRTFMANSGNVSDPLSSLRGQLLGTSTATAN
jgi:Tfp pilus assembly protein PilO